MKALIEFLGAITLVIIVTVAVTTIGYYFLTGVQASGGFALQVPYVAGASGDPDHGLFRRPGW